MAIDYRERVIPDSIFSRWDPRWKLATVLLASFGLAFLRYFDGHFVAFVLGALALFSAKLKWQSIFGSLGLILFGILPFIAILPFVQSGGTSLALAVLGRAGTIGLLTVLLIRTTSIDELFAAAHKLGIPSALVQIAQLAYRYGLLFFDETRRLRRNWRLRGFQTGTNLQTYRTFGSAAGTLLVRGADRAERIAEAMRVRGYRGAIPTLREFHTRWTDPVLFALFIYIAGMLLFLERIEIGPRYL